MVLAFETGGGDFRPVFFRHPENETHDMPTAAVNAVSRAECKVQAGRGVRGDGVHPLGFHRCEDPMNPMSPILCA